MDAGIHIDLSGGRYVSRSPVPFRFFPSSGLRVGNLLPPSRVLLGDFLREVVRVRQRVDLLEQVFQVVRRHREKLQLGIGNLGKLLRRFIEVFRNFHRNHYGISFLVREDLETEDFSFFALHYAIRRPYRGVENGGDARAADLELVQIARDVFQSCSLQCVMGELDRFVPLQCEVAEGGHDGRAAGEGRDCAGIFLDLVKLGIGFARNDLMADIRYLDDPIGSRSERIDGAYCRRRSRGSAREDHPADKQRCLASALHHERRLRADVINRRGRLVALVEVSDRLLELSVRFFRVDA